MGLTRRSESNRIYLQVKHSCLWQEFKRQTKDTEAVEVTNPSTGDVLMKHGIRYENVTGHVVKVETYKREHKGTRYVGFKVHFQEGAQVFVVDMPYQSQVLRRFLRICPNLSWILPVSLSIFPGKGKDGKPEVGIWFRQAGITIKAFHTKEEPHGMPAALQDRVTQEWDFRDQHRWLVEKLLNVHMPAIDMAAALKTPPVEPNPEATDEQQQPDDFTGEIPPHGDYISEDSDLPF